jgi:hypothetical protein
MVVAAANGRQEKPVATLSENEDFVSDLLAHGVRADGGLVVRLCVMYALMLTVCCMCACVQGLLFSASGDNTLAAYDLKQRKLLQR